MKHFENMVEYYRNHPEEAKSILKNAGKLDDKGYNQGWNDCLATMERIEND